MMSDKEMTVYTFDADIVSDLHKDAYGVRPSYAFWYEWKQATDDGRQAIWDGLLRDLGARMKEEDERQAKQIAKFESLVAKNIEYGASDRANAIAWICEAHNALNEPGFWGWEHLEYELGLPYGYISGVKPGFKA